MSSSRAACACVMFLFGSPLLVPRTLGAAIVDATHRHRGTATIDGVESPGEWAGALIGSFPVDLPQHFHPRSSQIEFYAMNDDDHLYVAARVEVDSSPSDPYFLYFEVGAWQGELSCVGTDIPDQFVVFSANDVAVVRDQHLLICEDPYDDDWTASGTVDTQGSWGIADGFTFFEMAQPLDGTDSLYDLNVSAPGLVGLNLTAGGGSSLPSGYGVTGAIVNVFLMTADTLLYADFEGGDVQEWTSAEE